MAWNLMPAILASEGRLAMKRHSLLSIVGEGPRIGDRRGAEERRAPKGEGMFVWRCWWREN